jgi:hypothetical protein
MASRTVRPGAGLRRVSLPLVVVALLAACAAPPGVPGGSPDPAPPLIEVGSPAPGAAVSNPFTVAGTSNTFEANLRYRLIDARGRVVADGHTTATAGNGTWGRFSFVLEAAHAGAHVVEVWQPDARTGERRDLVVIAVHVVGP